MVMRAGPIFEMFEASLAGELYDPEKWAKYYRPWGLEWEGDAEGGSDDDETTEAKTNAPKATVTADLAGAKKLAEAAAAEPEVEVVAEEPAAEVEEVVEEAPAAAPAASSTSAQAILDKIRARAND